MTSLKTAALCLTFLALTGGAAFAQTGSMMKSDGAMKTDSMAAKPMTMSAADMKTMKACKAMSHDMMMKNKACLKFNSMHPEAMKSDGAMSSGAMATDGMMKKK